MTTCQFLKTFPRLTSSRELFIRFFVTFLIAFFPQSRIFSQVVLDPTLGSDSSSVNPNPFINANGIPYILIEGGATKGENLFHSFEQFNVGQGQGVYFNNPFGVQRILSRVTGNSVSKIFGVLGVLGGNADLFLINPNGIIFGSQASLDIKGSLLATSATSLVFKDGTQFSARESSNLLQLTTSIPVGLQFRETSGDIFVNSDDLVGSSKATLAFVGGKVTVEHGFITVPSGRLELGSVAGDAYVSFQPVQNGWIFNYENIQDFNDIDILGRSSLLVESGDIQLQGRNISIKDASQIQGFEGIFKVSASDTVEISGFIPRRRGGFIFSGFVNDAISDKDVGGITINSRKLIIQDGGRITTRSTGLLSGNNLRIATANGGNLTINSSESVQLIGRTGVPTGLFSETASFGAAGNITINTQELNVRDGASISAESLGKNGLGQPFVTGLPGNISITALSIDVSNGSKISVSAKEGQAGNLTINANLLSLDQGSITAEIGRSDTADGANIILKIKDLLLLENESLISATAYNDANGGNIKIDTAILLALSPTDLNGSDIKAKAIGGIGGNISVNAQGIFGIQERIAIPGNQTNDIDASSDFGSSGQVQVKTTTDPNQGLVELPTTVIDPRTLVAQNPCRSASASEFTRSGRGGLPPSLSQDLSSQTTQVGLVEPTNLSTANPEPQTATKQATSVPLSSTQVTPARGWVYNDKGEVVLVAYNSAITGPQRLQSNPKGCPVL